MHEPKRTMQKQPEGRYMFTRLRLHAQTTADDIYRDHWLYSSYHFPPMEIESIDASGLEKPLVDYLRVKHHDHVLEMREFLELEEIGSVDELISENGWSFVAVESYHGTTVRLVFLKYGKNHRAEDAMTVLIDNAHFLKLSFTLCKEYIQMKYVLDIRCKGTSCLSENPESNTSFSEFVVDERGDMLIKRKYFGRDADFNNSVLIENYFDDED